MFDYSLEDRQDLGIKRGLERVKACLDYLGNPQEKFKSVLISGTNGKGSVTFYLSNLATSSTDYKIGRYISPHLVSWNERLVINEKVIESDVIDNFSFEVLKEIEKFENQSGKNKILTVFEVYTIIAFCFFAKEEVDIAFLEVGMGGRYDATNAMDSSNVLCSVITNVSFDHMYYLGNTIEKIAYEKAGLVKKNNFLVTAAENEALKVIENETNKLNSQLIKVNTEDCKFYQDKNVKVALRAWEVISNQIKARSLNAEKYLKSLNFPGRFQYFEKEKILLDGAHNPASGVELRKLLDDKFKNKKILYIIGMLNKDYENFINNLIPEGSNIICTEPKSERATKKEVLARSIVAKGSKAFLANDLQSAIDLAKTMEHDVIIVTGSLYLVGEALDIINKGEKCLLKHT